jgi:hypothetical protein
LTDKEKYDIIHKHIKSVSFCNAPDMPFTKQINIETYLNVDDTLTIKLSEEDEDIRQEAEENFKNRNKHIYYYNTQDRKLFKLYGTEHEDIPVVKRINPRVRVKTNQ